MRDRTTKVRDDLRDRYGIDDAPAYPNWATAAEDEACFDVAPLSILQPHIDWARS